MNKILKIGLVIFAIAAIYQGASWIMNRQAIDIVVTIFIALSIISLIALFNYARSPLNG